MKTKQEVNVIRSQKQHRQYLKKIEELMAHNPSPKTSDGQLLETLSILVEDYERKQQWEIPSTVDPVAIIQQRMADLNLKQSDLATVMGDKTVVSRILKRSRKLTYLMVMPLSELLRVPPELLLEKKI